MHDAKGTGGFELLLDAIRRDKNPMTSDRTNRIAHTAVYKINTCKSTCFDNLEKKTFVAVHAMATPSPSHFKKIWVLGDA
jgi:hypothetical protein